MNTQLDPNYIKHASGVATLRARLLACIAAGVVLHVSSGMGQKKETTAS